MDIQTNGWTNQRTYQQMDGWTDRQKVRQARLWDKDSVEEFYCKRVTLGNRTLQTREINIVLSFTDNNMYHNNAHQSK